MALQIGYQKKGGKKNQLKRISNAIFNTILLALIVFILWNRGLTLHNLHALTVTAGFAGGLILMPAGILLRTWQSEDQLKRYRGTFISFLGAIILLSSVFVVFLIKIYTNGDIPPLF